MNELTGNRGHSAWMKIIYILLVVAAGFVVIGPLIGLLLAIPFFEGSFLELADLLSTDPTHPSLKIPLYVMQAGATFFGLILLPALFYYVIEKKSVLRMQSMRPLYPVIVLLTTVIVISFMVVNSILIEWNTHVVLPDALKGFEQWAREKEDLATAITKFLTSFSTFGEFALAFVVIAVLPGIGEELVFRGMLQPELHRATKNSHAAIWISAIVFSAFHLQFFGFLPRVLLGALFGYLYYWSGNLAISMFAHFMNNGFMVVMIYLNQKGAVEMDVESSESAPLWAVLIFTIITFGLLFYFKKYCQSRNLASS